MNERDFEIEGRKYKLNKIDTFKQFHIARRLSPIMGEIMMVAPKVKEIKDDMSESEKLNALAQLAKPVMEGFSKLSDEDANFVLLGLCGSVEVHQSESNSWARIARDNTLLFNTLELPTLLQLAGRAFMFNLSGFINTAQRTSHGAK
jgi:hypothetical protein